MPPLMKSLFLFFCLATAVLARQPNVVLILADDLGRGDLGCYGQKIIRTPNLDRMAAEGMKLMDHYSGNAVCAPSRCVLMTGMHPGHAFIRDNRQADNAKGLPKMGKPEHEGQFPIPDATQTMPEAFRAAGYVTGGFGKWGLGGPGSTGEPLKQGFDRWFGYNCQGVAHNFYPTYLWDNDKTIDLKNAPFPSNDKLRPDEDPSKPESYKRFQGREYSADLIADAALDFVRENKERPFFLYWPTTVPHLALQVPDDSLAEYVGKFDDPPYPGGKGYTPHFRPRAAYAAMVTRMDREIGKMMTLIADLGLDENTIFIFISDNGSLHGTHQGLGGVDAAFFDSSGGLRDGKGTLYEGGIRSPGIVRWKGQVAAGSTSTAVTGFEDWMPTLLDLCGIQKASSDIDGLSFAALLRGKGNVGRDFLYREFTGYGGQQCVRMGKWKYIRTGLSAGPKSKRGAKTAEELYDLENDAGESKNVIAEHPDVVAKIQEIAAREHRNSAEFKFPALDK
ncbi:MAG: arylsulfatase [Verrucomicrobiaceae bacterium]|nr:arylsulfatase [Verrucomicrobiaceae bacterium]